MILNLERRLTKNALDARVVLDAIRAELNLTTLDQTRVVLARHGEHLPTSRQGTRRALLSIRMRLDGNRVTKI